MGVPQKKRGKILKFQWGEARGGRHDFDSNLVGRGESWRLQHRCFPVINAKFLRTPILKDVCQRLLLKFIRCCYFDFRRYFRSSSLLEFYKIGVLKTSAKFLGKLKCRRFFSIKLQTNNVETSIGLGGGDLNIINQWGYHEKGGDKI